MGYEFQSNLLTASEDAGSLRVAPLVYSQVPYEVLISSTDPTNLPQKR
jgi:hypothetical protein